MLRGALARLACSVYTRHYGGDHVILIGRVADLDLGDGDHPLIFYEHQFWSLTPLTA